VILTGDTSGTLTVSAPLVAGSNTVTLPAATGTISLLERATSVASTSGTSIDFTSIPSWAKRITVMLSGVSTSGTSNLQIQLGTGGSPTYTTSGYNSVSITGGGTAASFTAGLGIVNGVSAAQNYSGLITIANQTSNTWVSSGYVAELPTSNIRGSSGSIALGAALTAIRLTTVNGTDTFDAGSINVIWEG
jgi:hypothetical protein